MCLLIIVLLHSMKLREVLTNKEPKRYLEKTTAGKFDNEYEVLEKNTATQ